MIEWSIGTLCYLGSFFLLGLLLCMEMHASKNIDCVYIWAMICAGLLFSTYRYIQGKLIRKYLHFLRFVWFIITIVLLFRDCSIQREKYEMYIGKYTTDFTLHRRYVNWKLVIYNGPYSRCEYRLSPSFIHIENETCFNRTIRFISCFSM